jgi:hypothetical protein
MSKWANADLTEYNAEDTRSDRGERASSHFSPPANSG